MGKAEIRNFSTSLQLGISQVSAVIFHILQAMRRRKIALIPNLVPRSHSVTGNVRSGKVRQYTIFHWPLKKGCGNAIYAPIGLFREARNEGLVFASSCAVLNKYQLCGGKFCFFRRRKSFRVKENQNLRCLCKWYRRKLHVPCHSNKVLRSLIRGTQKLINSS